MLGEMGELGLFLSLNELNKKRERIRSAFKTINIHVTDH